MLVATAQAIHLGWIPSSDDGVIALRAFDVFSAHPPLLGQSSQTSALISTPFYSLGPMLYWVLAVPAHVGAKAIVVTMGAISSLAVLGVVAMAYRRAGAGFTLLVAAAMVVMFRSLPAEVPYEVWGAWAGLLPFTALIFLAWSVACGAFKLLPLLVLVASYVVQCHLTYLAPTVGCLAVALVGLSVQRRRVAQNQDPRNTGMERRRSMRRWTYASMVVLVLSWIAPVIEEIVHRPGNLTLASRLATAGYRSLGNSEGFWALGRAVGFPPLWMGAPPTPREEFLGLFSGPPASTEVTALVVLAGLTTSFVVGLRRGRDDVASAAALGIVLAVSIGLVARSLPAGGLGLAASVYVLTWASPAGMFVYVALAWSAWCLLPRARAVEPRIPHVELLLGCAAILMLSVLSANRAVDSPSRLPPRLGSYATIRAITTRAADRLDRRHPVLLEVANTLGQSSRTLQSAMAYEMRRRGIPFAVSPRLANELGEQYCPKATAYPDVVIISEGGVIPERGTTLLASSPSATVTLAQAPSATHDQREALAREEQNVDVPSRCAHTPTIPRR